MAKDIVLLYHEEKESMVIIHRWPSLKNRALDDLDIWVVSCKPNSHESLQHKVVYNLLKTDIVSEFESKGYVQVGANVTYSKNGQ